MSAVKRYLEDLIFDHDRDEVYKTLSELGWSKEDIDAVYEHMTEHISD